MEDELKCPSCRQFFTQPVLLPCFHAMCLNCALHNQQPVVNNLPSHPTAQPHEQQQEQPLPPPPTELQLLSELQCHDCNDSDQLSILSETDSGVVVSTSGSSGGSSRPSSCHIHPASSSSSSTTTTNNSNSNALVVAATISLSCPSCRKIVYFDENGAQNLPRYRAMQTIVDKFSESSHQRAQASSTPCQLCDTTEGGQQQEAASVFCQQCQVFYCDRCRENCHPARGPLAKHSLISPHQGRQALRSLKEKFKQQSSGEAVQHCAEHGEQTQTYYCNTCRLGACHLCVLSDVGRHHNHDVHLLALICKQQKAELTQSLQQLSEKAKSATEVIQRLKSSSERVQESCANVESAIHSQCLELMEALRRREEALVDFARRERDLQLRRLREEVATCTAHLQHTTALVQFCIEALKESDSSAFLQIGSMLVNRVSNLDLTWRQEMDELTNRASPTLELTLDDLGLRRNIDQLTFLEMKPPGAPRILAEDCSAENNSITVAWQPHPASFVEGFVLELDDGVGVATGRFREVYCGKETICTVDGLHFNSLYNARVKAFNSSGEGPYSDPLGLHTAEVAWFTFDMTAYPAETRLSADGLTATTDSYEPRVLLSSVGFSRGVHYWEFTVDRYDGAADPAFGVARRDVTRDSMLGKDELGWSMYIDHQRSWFLHNNVHSHRTDGGIDVGSTVGVLLDLDRRQLSFFVNEEPQGTVAFVDLCGVFYPAVSLNRNVQVTLHSALDPPPSSSSFPDSGEESDEGHQIDAGGDVSERMNGATNNPTDSITSLTCAVAAL
ncbi:E3 ubiquitin-protein ligase TRIM9-like isoform X1 [Daphnia pulicaria]|uniref:E3 ubiquitin-protein ligase TRIM9-like isoform X1 n=1 Tax=Daphnia pulicaria TaxID=35523 RepID=UPI001EEBDA3A|nr:E3 ubiquitin-protein ligase TRIM9-like isoform X1 [Daphnia pulicaria]